MKQIGSSLGKLYKVGTGGETFKQSDGAIRSPTVNTYSRLYHPLRDISRIRLVESAESHPKRGRLPRPARRSESSPQVG